MEAEVCHNSGSFCEENGTAHDGRVCYWRRGRNERKKFSGNADLHGNVEIGGGKKGNRNAQK